MLRVITSPSTGGVPVVERDLALEGESAGAWLVERGWRPDGSARALRVAGDVVRSDDFAVGRIWHNALRLTRLPGPPGTAGTIILEGDIDVRTEEGSMRLASGEGVLFDATKPSEWVASRATATLELRVDAQFESRYGVTGIHSAERLRADSRLMRMLSGLANSAVSNSDADDPTWPLQQASLENLFAAVISESADGQVDSRSPARDRLLRAASRRIDARARDSSFTIAALATELSVSERSIQQAFAAAGSTAKRALTRVRLRHARELLRRSEGGAADHEAVARLSGFKNARALLRALAASDGDSAS